MNTSLPATDEVSGSVDTNFARYRVLMPLGRGGMSEVLLAEAVRKGGFRKLVVLKRLLAEMSSDVQMRSGFMREGELSARLNHPNVVQVHEVHEEDGAPVLVMEFLDGLTLAEILHGLTEEIPLRLHVHVLCQVLAGLHYFHELCDYDGSPLGAVHRDVSPHNVMLTYEGAIKVLDFGIAKQANVDGDATATGMVKGKLHYMPAEQLTSPKTLTRAADIFAVGVMLWEAAAKRRMWKGMGQGQVMQALISQRLPSLSAANPEVDAELVRIVEKALAPEPANRWSTALEFEEALDAYLVSLGGPPQQRELGRFMTEHFGQARLQRHQAIDLASKGARTSSSTTNSGGQVLATSTGSASKPTWGTGSGSKVISGTGQSVSVSIAQGDVLAPSVPQRRRSVAVPMLAAVVALLAVVVVLIGLKLRAQPTRQLAAPVNSAAVALVHFSIVVSPPNAMIIVNDRQVPNPFVAELRQQELLRVRVSAPGYRSEEREFQSAEGKVAIALEPLPVVEPQPSVSAVSAPSASASVVNVPPRRVVRVGPVASLPVKAGAGSCDPPFTLAADGVKVYKPECL